ncbi:hypothetical protein ER308_00745 [Egibacter rhizosphaerae]|uniref:AP2-like integrase N-terminal domain-containing protein n=1 Tax=Egibacter rhizosphaerae TaxID=1670831 RepID=A0A411YAJ7_9ACTN|nr:hypothetical protein [Egibacter rhizosphaerae]QBI18243.1 hypothetical protein ER308_00745 [Egibacter rhizosphaerae]
MTETARRHFRVLTRTRGGSAGGTMYDVQLQAQDTGNLLWAQTFSHQAEAEAYEATVTGDLETLDDATFRRKYGVPTHH